MSLLCDRVIPRASNINYLKTKKRDYNMITAMTISITIPTAFFYIVAVSLIWFAFGQIKGRPILSKLNNVYKKKRDGNTMRRDTEITNFIFCVVFCGPIGFGTWFYYMGCELWSKHKPRRRAKPISS